MTRAEEGLRAELEERLRFEALLADLSARFVHVPADQVDRMIEEAQRRIVQALGLDRSTLLQRAEAGRLKVHLSATFPLAEAASAHEAMERDHTHGKIVLTM